MSILLRGLLVLFLLQTVASEGAWQADSESYLLAVEVVLLELKLRELDSRK